ncbi:hypothetical protein YDYSY3_47600 [Paenibacillus chitinolyticus]|uniref:hypothetical protein n=1 Tax=Paenibacillus chitinolyticus TaxID=79263 RepID=UPI0026E500CF|nr:hypothetical protein [Paenibacillus chitinolyticus]GKS13760.1 hypothetical protein YDYSY3_47600 [Paenibacillus chitinolyticus]
MTLPSELSSIFRHKQKSYKMVLILSMPGGRGIHSLLLTSKYMLDRAVEIAELRLESEADLMQWREKRRQGSVRVELDHQDVDLARQVLGVEVR